MRKPAVWWQRIDVTRRHHHPSHIFNEKISQLNLVIFIHFDIMKISESAHVSTASNLDQQVNMRPLDYISCLGKQENMPGPFQLSETRAQRRAVALSGFSLAEAFDVADAARRSGTFIVLRCSPRRGYSFVSQSWAEAHICLHL